MLASTRKTCMLLLNRSRITTVIVNIYCVRLENYIIFRFNLDSVSYRLLDYLYNVKIPVNMYITQLIIHNLAGFDYFKTWHRSTLYNKSHISNSTILIDGRLWSDTDSDSVPTPQLYHQFETDSDSDSTIASLIQLCIYFSLCFFFISWLYEL